MVTQCTVERMRRALYLCAAEGYLIQSGMGCMPLDEDEVGSVRRMRIKATSAGYEALSELIKANDALLAEIGRIW